MFSSNQPYNIKNKFNLFDDFERNLLHPNTILNGRYKIEKPIFRNNCFVNYLAFDKFLNSRVIIKEFFPVDIVCRKYGSNEILIKSEFVQLFANLSKNFISIYKVLQKFKVSSCVVKVYYVFECNNTSYCVHELPVGLTLKKFLSNNYGELTWNQSKFMFLELINFFQNLHNSNILYCNLSPETIIVCDNKLKIIDFSNAILNGKFFYKKPVLHDGYYAVEQYNNSTKLGTFTDVYSIAAVIYKSLTGTKPVNSNSRLLNDNLLSPEKLNITIPKSVSISVMSALIPSPKLRTQTMNDFYDDLTAKPREFYKSSIQKFEFFTHINTIEPIKSKTISKNKNKELSTRSLIFVTMVISASTILFAAAIFIFILFHDSFFK